MDLARARRLNDHCIAASRLVGRERDAFLARLRAEDPAIADDVATMLADVAQFAAAAREETSALDKLLGQVELRAAQRDLHAIASDPHELGVPPDAIAGFRLLRRIGQGGMGVVYEAEQDNPRRRVALKLMQPSFDTERQGRFELEGALLGRLHHPNIAQIHACGTFRGPLGEQPYIAMELIEGVDLRTHVGRAQLSPKDRLALFAQVVDGVHHAHDRGVVHRDLKPDNVLVDSLGTAKVVDFGIARALDGESDATRLTRTGQMIGTLAYMSPEQVRGGGVIDARADVYALGVILYELLAERLPVAVDGLPLAEAARAICEDEATRLSQHTPTLRGDLDTIVATALAKEPARRYQSAAALAADLRRFVRHEPITAQPATALYRVRKFVRRHRALVFATLTTIVALAIGLVSTMVVAIENGVLLERESAARRTADQNLYRAEMLLASSSILEPAGWSAARELLAHWRPRAAAPDLRGFEWFLFSSFGHECVAQLPAPLRVENCEWHPGRPWLAVAAHAEVRVLDVASRRELFVRSYGHHVDMHWSADGALLLIGFTTGFEVLRANDFEPLRSVALPIKRGVSATCWSPDAARVAVTFFDGSVAVYDWRTGVELVQRPDLITGRGCGFSPDGTRIALPRGDCAQVVDAVSLVPLIATQRGPSVTSAVAWCPDGQELATAHGDGSILICSASDGRERARLATLNRQGALRLAWDARGKQIAASFSDFAVGVWDRAAPQHVRMLPGHGASALGVAWSSQGQLATGCGAGELRVWDLVPLAARRTLLGSQRGGGWMNLRWHPDGQRLAVNWNTRCHWVDSAVGPEQTATTFGGGQGSWSADGAWFMFELDGRAVLRDVAGVERPFGERADQWLAWDPSRPAGAVFLRTGPRDLRVVDVASGATELHVVLESKPVAPPAFSRDGSRVALLCDGGRVEVRELARGTLLGARDLPATVRLIEAAFSPDGSDLVVAGGDGKLRRFAVANDGDVRELSATSRMLLGVAWHPTAPRIAAVGEDGICRLWDSDTNALVAALPSTSELEAVSWRPDGKLLAVARHDGVLEFWDAAIAYGREGVK